MAVCFNYFLNIDISQGSVVTYVRCAGIFKYEFVADLALRPPAKEFKKSVKIWGIWARVYCLVFLTHDVCVCLIFV